MYPSVEDGKFMRELVGGNVPAESNALYVNIQNSHIIPIDKPKAFPVRTTYDTIVAYRMDRRFVGYASEDGVIDKVTSNAITVIYKESGKKVYSIKDWTSKEESNTSYIHKLVSNVKEKQKVKYGDIIYYDPAFFEIDMFDKTKVFYRANTNINIAWQEVQESYEDAIMLSKEVGEGTTVSEIKIRDLVLDKSDEITELADIGKPIHPNASLFTLVSNVIKDDKLDKETLDLLQSFIKVSPKAKYKGKLIKVKVYYNCEYKELSKSLRNLVDISKPYMFDISRGKTYEGKVNGGYSINGVPLELGKLHIKFYIDVNSGMTPGDKCVIASQLKSTVTTLYDYPIKTNSGMRVDAIFSAKGSLARIVVSPQVMGTLATCLEKITEGACDIYFK